MPLNHVLDKALGFVALGMGPDLLYSSAGPFISTDCWQDCWSKAVFF